MKTGSAIMLAIGIVVVAIVLSVGISTWRDRKTAHQTTDDEKTTPEKRKKLSGGSKGAIIVAVLFAAMFLLSELDLMLLEHTGFSLAEPLEITLLGGAILALIFYQYIRPWHKLIFRERYIAEAEGACEHPHGWRYFARQYYEYVLIIAGVLGILLVSTLIVIVIFKLDISALTYGMGVGLLIFALISWILHRHTRRNKVSRYGAEKAIDEITLVFSPKDEEDE